MARFRKRTMRAMVMMVAYSSRRSTPPAYMGRSRKRWTITPSTKTEAMARGSASHHRSQPRRVARSAYWI